MPFHQNLRARWALVMALAVAGLFTGNATCLAGRLFRNGAVGGVSIDARGVVSQPSQAATQDLRNAMREQLQPAEQEMAEATELRRISLKALAQQVKVAADNNYELADEVKYLAGLQRIKYVFVYPEQNDIVLAGPGEGWTVSESGDIVGITTGKPVLHLEDLLVALRTVNVAREVGVSCSIDPTEEGTQQMQRLMRKQSVFNPQILPQIEEAMGPQRITLTGVPEGSHFARVLVAADYRMKRIAMDLEESPVGELPSFLDMMAHSREKITNMMPRWWLACDYEPMARTEDGLGWELRGPGVKVMTEDDAVATDGTRQASGRTSNLAQKWADKMTAQYEPLSAKSPVFGQLRNLMDLCVIAAVIERNGLVEKAGCNVAALTASDTDLLLGSWNAPKTVSTQCSFTKRGREYLITASGGVQIESWQSAQREQVETHVASIQAKAKKQTDRWWE